MGSLKVTIDDEAEERFRRAAMKKFGYGKGALSKAAEAALDEWASKVDFPSNRIEIPDPVEAIKGILKTARGSTSVELQHEVSKMRARKK